ncbi:hypothetical protein QE152_g36276 [Popillia japonica]|uniref:Uncharacterized protein n=1 Tax=Popillia japonica TaxID=7064 RepID=A0AAW1IDM6_POPJA
MRQCPSSSVTCPGNPGICKIFELQGHVHTNGSAKSSSFKVTSTLTFDFFLPFLSVPVAGAALVVRQYLSDQENETISVPVAGAALVVRQYLSDQENETIYEAMTWSPQNMDLNVIKHL